MVGFDFRKPPLGHHTVLPSTRAASTSPGSASAVHIPRAPGLIPSRHHGCFTTKLITKSSMTWIILGYSHGLETSKLPYENGIT